MKLLARATRAPLLQTLYKGNSTILLDRNNTHNFGTLWYNNVEQFMCTMTDCTQTIVNDVYKNVCNSGSCQCAGTSTFCGGPGVVFNLQSSLAVEFLNDLFADGLPLSDCLFGECAYASQNPFLVNSNSNPLSTEGIVGVAVAGVCVVVASVVFGWSLFYQIKARKESVPSPQKGADIEFKNMSYTLPNGQIILSEITSTAYAGAITAIMGPSGAGKSTLLDILAGKEKSGTILGNLTFDGEALTQKEIIKAVAFVDQDDLLLPSMTVRETLLFSAKLRLPESMSTKEKEERVDSVLDTLALSHVAHSRVGGFGKRGISGGERRRVSIGVELVTEPGILLLDEPSSGLDSFNAHAVIETLHNLAHVHGKTVVLTCHQPRSDTFALFDNVIVLAAGKALYIGRRSDCASKIKSDGTPCPEGYNIADHLLDLAMKIPREQSKNLAKAASSPFVLNVSGSGFRRSRGKTSGANHIELTETNTSTGTPENEFVHKSNSMNRGVSVGFLTQITELVGRSFKHLVRTPSLLLAHLSLSIILGIFVGGVYYHSDDSISGVQNRLGSLFFILSLVGFSSLSVIGSMAQERNLFLREKSNGVYGSMPYYLSKILCDILPLRILPAFLTGTIAFFMVGYDASGSRYPKFLVLLLLFSAIMGLMCMCLAAAISDVGTATLAGAIIILFKMLFAGLIISQDSIPWALRWIQYLSFFRYPYEGMAVNDMGLLQISDTFDGAAVNLPASLILTKFGFDINNYGQDLLITIVLFVLLVALAGIVIDLRLRERR
ncbi:hypothetical protein HK100_003307 [Physocladia obscura]|uniref:ABC transporter domain-containing protein n=1 Tax=Physocladia obscura TaxID=109957 RepID=A0AAD5SUH0_9FUNG|nr:hypothetical protein HK100_003307 [Physocladia obscura]